MTILDNVHDRAVWLATASTLVLRIQQMETKISAAFTAHPTQRQSELLMEADQELGAAVVALSSAAAKIQQLTQIC